jgi:hypothetical protein
MTSERPPWDDARARAMIGSHVLVGLTRTSAKGETREQMFGTVRSVDPSTGFEIALDGSRKGQTYWLPPQFDVFKTAEPGSYRLRSTGEVVENPDYLASWTVEPPPV